jgi:hypothetical protein
MSIRPRDSVSAIHHFVSSTKDREENFSLFSRLLSLSERAENDDKIEAQARTAKRKRRTASRASFSRYVE